MALILGLYVGNTLSTPSPWEILRTVNDEFKPRLRLAITTPSYSPSISAIAGARQIIDVDVTMAQTSCGMAVPFFECKGERDQLVRWAEKKGEAGIRQYWEEKNQVSLDGKLTDILKNE